MLEIMSKGEKTRLRIIETALDCFYEVGITETTFKMISGQSGLTQPGIYAYFSDKNALLLACSEYAIERGREFGGSEFEGNQTAKQVLRAYLFLNLNWVYKDRKTVHSLIAMYYFGTTYPPLKKFHAEIDLIAIKRIDAYLQAGNRESEWKIKDTDKIARLIHSLMVGEMMKAFHWPKDLKLEEREKELWGFVYRMLKD
jgi:AcrR family transcriptional regulator